MGRKKHEKVNMGCRRAWGGRGGPGGKCMLAAMQITWACVSVCRGANRRAGKARVGERSEQGGWGGGGVRDEQTALSLVEE